MTRYKSLKLLKSTRWDELAYKYYGDCYKYQPIISANPNIAIGEFIPEGTVVLIPIPENTNYTDTDNLPSWKQEQ